MKGNQKDVEIDRNITYSPISQTFNKPLKIVNHSDQIYVFKIKTNQRTVVSLQTTHDFIYPHSTRQIAIKLAEKPSETNQLKLEFNYAIPNEEDIKNKDSKMNSISKENIFKTIITIERNDNPDLTAIKSPKKIDASEKIGTPSKDNEKLVSSTPVKFAEEKQRYDEKGQDTSFLSGKGQEINITQLIDVGKSATIEIENSTKIDPFQESPEPKPQKKIETTFKHVESQQIQIPAKVEESPSKPQNMYPNLENVFFSSSKSSEFKPAESYMQSTSSKGKSEQELVIAELQEKILKEKATIKTLQSSASQGSIYPLPVIFGLIIATFVFGSMLGTLLV